MEIYVRDNDDGEVSFSGDLFFRIYNKSPKSSNLICRFALNTSFMDLGADKSSDGMLVYHLDRKGVDPDSVAKNKDYDVNFGIEVHYKNACDVCNP